MQITYFTHSKRTENFVVELLIKAESLVCFGFQSLSRYNSQLQKMLFV